MSETHSPVLVRMTNELKAQLQRSAVAHGKTLTAEIIQRLLNSFSQAEQGVAPGPHSYPKQPLVTVMQSNDSSHNLASHNITDLDQAMLSVFRSLPPHKQLSLLTLLK